MVAVSRFIQSVKTRDTNPLNPFTRHHIIQKWFLLTLKVNDT